MENTCVCCGAIIPEGIQVCPNCVASVFHTPKSEYIEFNCPECDAPLEVYYEGPIEEYPGKPWDFVWGSRRDLIRHCNKCGRDWENEWITVDTHIVESELKRKFWG